MSCWHRQLKNSDDIQSLKTVRHHNEIQSKRRSPDGNTKSSFLTTNAESDKNVIEWWRSHHQESDINDFVRDRGQANLASKANKHEDEFSDQNLVHDISPSTTIPQFTNTLDDSQPRTQERPYNMPHQDFLTKPQNGMVLDPRLFPMKNGNDEITIENPSLGIFATRGRSDSDDGTDRIEFFQPQIVRRSHAKQQKWKLQSQNLNSPSPPQLREIVAAKFTSEREEGKVVSHSAVVVKNKNIDDHSLSQERKVPDTSSKEVKMLKKKLSLSKFIARKSKSRLATAKDVTESSDHLSDVPSDIDSITRERYLLACQMLKMTIIQKESALIPIEKEYILSLLDDFESHSVDGSNVSLDHINSIERAVLQLENDSISKFSHDTASVDLPSPATAARVQKSQKVGGVVRAVTSLSPRNDKNPHTATRKPKQFMKHISNACNPAKSANLFGSKNDQPHKEDSARKSNIVAKDTEIFHNDTDRLVRFDGWSFQNLIEYPFIILDADGYDTKPRVFTPGMMEALRGFMPMQVMDHNFWLRFSLARDGPSFAKLLASVRASTFTMIGVETDRGEVFGSFTGSPWRIGSKWYGTSEAYLWRLKQNRLTSPGNSRKPNFEREMEVYPCTEDDDLIQYCTAKTIAVGGGEWQHHTCPYRDSGQGIGLVIDGDLVGGETNSCATFANPKLARYASSSSEFVISNLEVWALTPCVNVEDATKLEMREFFVEGYGIR